jgi:hypothetical protein
MSQNRMRKTNFEYHLHRDTELFFSSDLALHTQALYRYYLIILIYETIRYFRLVAKINPRDRSKDR